MDPIKSFHFLLKIPRWPPIWPKIYYVLPIGQFSWYKVDLVVYTYVFGVKEFNFVHQKCLGVIIPMLMTTIKGQRSNFINFSVITEKVVNENAIMIKSLMWYNVYMFMIYCFSFGPIK